MATAAQAEPLLTVEEFARRPDPGFPEELVRGRIVRMNPPRPYHGWLCGNVFEIVKQHVRERDLGYVMSNDSGVVTARHPDTLRGADVAFYSYARVPKGTLPRDRYLEVAPELVVEVLSPDDRWPKVLEKVAEYLNAGVAAVVVLDPGPRQAHVYRADAPVRVLDAEEGLTLPDVLPGFRAALGRFFE